MGEKLWSTEFRKFRGGRPIVSPTTLGFWIHHLSTAEAGIPRSRDLMEIRSRDPGCPKVTRDPGISPEIPGSHERFDPGIPDVKCGKTERFDSTSIPSRCTSNIRTSLWKVPRVEGGLFEWEHMGCTCWVKLRSGMRKSHVFGFMALLVVVGRCGVYVKCLAVEVIVCELLVVFGAVVYI
eukprot:1365946-Amorphochlora_amoeboformis.AAC.1